MRLKWFVFISLAGALALMNACSGPDDKKLKFYNNAKKFYEKNDFVKASIELKNAIQIDPKYADAYYLLGMAELQKGNLGGAFGTLQKAVELNPQNLDAQSQYGRLLLISKEMDKAREKANFVLKSKPDHPEGLILLGSIYLADNKPEKTIAVMDGMLQSGKAGPEIFQLLAAAYRDQKNNKGAEQVLLQGIQKNEKSVALRRTLVELYTELRQVDKAVDQIRSIMGLEPGNHNYPITLASLYWDTGQEEKAQGVIKELLARSGNNESMIVDVANLVSYHSQFSEAEKILLNALPANNKSFKIRFALSDLYAKSGRLEQAQKILLDCLALNRNAGNPQIIETKNVLARIHLSRRETAEAERYVSEVLKESAQNPDATLIKGELALLKGDGARAVTAFRTFVSDRPKNLAGFVYLAEAHQVNNEPKLAQEVLQQAQKLEPNSRELQKALSRFYAAQKDYVTAEKYLRGMIARQPNDLEARTSLGDMFLAIKDYRRAESEYGAVKRFASKIPIGYVKMSELYLVQGRDELAIAELEQARKLVVENALLDKLLVQCYLKTRRYDAALEICNSKLRKGGDVVDTHLLRGEVYAAQGQYPKAYEAVADAQKAGGDPVKTALIAANLSVRGGDLKRARATFEELSTKEPDNWIVANDFASFLNDNSSGSVDIEKAVKLAEKANKLKPDTPAVLDTLGWAHCRKGEYRKAEEVLMRLSARLPDSPEINYHYGMTSLYNNKTLQAKALLEKAVSGRDFQGRQQALETLKKL